MAFASSGSVQVCPAPTRPATMSIDTRLIQVHSKVPTRWSGWILAPLTSDFRSFQVKNSWIAACLMIGAAAFYYFSNRQPHSPYDYTLRIAEAFLHGNAGLTGEPPSWLNELIPYQGRYYSAFHLGSVPFTL